MTKSSDRIHSLEQTIESQDQQLNELRLQLESANASFNELKSIIHEACLAALDAEEARIVLLSFASRATTPSELLNLTRALVALNH